MGHHPLALRQRRHLGCAAVFFAVVLGASPAAGVGIGLAQAMQSRDAIWAKQTQVWAVWEAQRQAWMRVGHESQTTLRLWHWLGTASVHGVRWTHWQQEGQRWTVSGEAKGLDQVREWLVSGDHRPTPVDREVAVSQSQQWADGRIGFVLTWEELP